MGSIRRHKGRVDLCTCVHRGDRACIVSDCVILKIKSVITNEGSTSRFQDVPFCIYCSLAVGKLVVIYHRMGSTSSTVHSASAPSMANLWSSPPLEMRQQLDQRHARQWPRFLHFSTNGDVREKHNQKNKLQKTHHFVSVLNLF